MKVEVYTDGGSRGNPGEAAIGIVVYKDEECIYEQASYIGIATNNEAEYQGLLAALKWVVANQDKLANVKGITFKLDSKLVVEQVSKNWKIKEKRLAKYAEQCWQLINELPYPVELTHVARDDNQAADALVNQALDANQSKS